MAISQLIEQTIAQHITQPKVLSYAPTKLNEVMGRFVASNRVYNFVLNKDGVSYSPAGQGDSLLFSALFLRQDGVRKPKVGNDKCNAGRSYQCGKICLGNRRKCHKGVRDVNDARRIASILESTNRGLESKVAGDVSDKAIARGRALFEARGARFKNGKTERVKIEIKPESKKAKTNRAKLKSLSDIPNIPESAKPWVKSVESLATPELVAIAGKVGFPAITASSKSGAYYISSDNIVHMATHKQSNPFSVATFLHEYGHYIDYNLGERISRKPISSTEAGILARKLDENIIRSAQTQSIYKSISPFVDKSIVKGIKESKNLLTAKLKPDYQASADIYKTSKEVLAKSIELGLDMTFSDRQAFRQAVFDLERLSDGLNTDDPMTLARAAKDNIRGYVIDLLGAITKNRIGHGHSDNYYKKNKNAQGTEAFANIIAIANSGDEKAIAVAKKFAPNMWKFVMDSIKV